MKKLFVLAFSILHLLFASESITLTTIEDENLTLTSTEKGIDFGRYKGKVVILDFMHTSCPPCFQEIKHLVELQEKYPKQVQVISLVLNKNRTNKELRSLMARYDVNYLVTNSPNNQRFADALGGIDMFPTVIIFDQEGIYVNDYKGIVSQETLEGDIEMIIED